MYTKKAVKFRYSHGWRGWSLNYCQNVVLHVVHM